MLLSRTEVAVFRLLLWRYARERYLQNWAGPLWVILVPLAQLAIYAFVFVEIFKARVPEADTVGFVPYLAVAFWPWTAFADAVMRATPSVVENRDLIGKVALPAEALPAASASATFLLTLAGYVAVLIVLAATGTPIGLVGLPLMLTMVLCTYFLALGLSLLFSALQVYARDLNHALGPLFMLWFFTTPILYSIDLIPERLRGLAQLNPFYYIVSRIRDALLFDAPRFRLADIAFLVASALFMLLCVAVFRRLSRRFEDYL
ncbi:MAG: ABC transporter permease [Xanthomonadales bacterium]|nr:ABC transporter permease [Xanthomonadales bacterium]